METGTIRFVRKNEIVHVIFERALTLEARKMLLCELMSMQDQTQLPLITSHEVRLIEDQWNRDESTAIIRDVGQLVQLAIGDS